MATARNRLPDPEPADLITPHISQQLKALGIAQVIVVLKRARGDSHAMPPPGAVAASLSRANGLESYFQNSELSQKTALSAARPVSVALGRVSVERTGQSAPAPPVQHFRNLGVMLGTVTQQGLEGLQNDDRVATVTGAPQFSLISPRHAKPARLMRAATWGLELLEVPRLWKQGLSGKGIRVAHLDTGVDGRHPALKKAIVEFAQLDLFGERVVPSPAPFDSDEHGTHTAGTIAGREVQGKSIGVAPGADLFSAMVIEGGDVIARVLGGIDWALERGVKVLSMSLGLRGWWEDFVPVVQILRARNVLPVMAVGNEGPGTSRSPGNYPEVLSVGAVDGGAEVPVFSSSQKFQRPEDPDVPDVVAPGVNVISAQPNNRYQSMDGTSMATPHVAGLAALLFEAKPTATANEVEEVIFRSCKLGGIPRERGNRGVPNAVVALKELTGVDAAMPREARRIQGKTSRKSHISKQTRGRH